MFRTAIKILILWCLMLLAFIVLRQVPDTNAEVTPTSAITFCEILPNPDGTDTKDNEYFKLANSSLEGITLTNWKVCNVSNDCYSLKELVEAGNCLKIPRTAFGFTLHNDKEELSLFDPENNLVDKITATSAPSGKAWQCFEGNCAWGAPLDSCDYSFLVPPDDFPENENTNNSPDTSENSNDNFQLDPINTNNNSNNSPVINKDKSYLINDAKDFSRMRKTLRKEKLVSVLVSIKGTVAIPPGIMAKTYFYLSSQDQLIKTHAYSSCQNSPDCLRDIELAQGKKLSIQTATLKLIDGRFELYLDKSARITDEGKKKLKKTTVASNFSGTIVAKKGDYFFVENSKKNEINSIYIPPALQNAYAKRLNTIPLGYFPFYLASTPSKSWVGGSIDASGVAETVGEEKRIIAYELNKLKPADAQPEEKKNAKETAEKPKKTESEKPLVEAPKSEETKTEKNETAKPNKEQLKSILAQNLSWQSLWEIIVSKLSIRLSSWGNYF